eukprot:6186709-Pleurochrysis_carterae.AAC.6
MKAILHLWAAADLKGPYTNIYCFECWIRMFAKRNQKLRARLQRAEQVRNKCVLVLVVRRTCSSTRAGVSRKQIPH